MLYACLGSLSAVQIEADDQQALEVRQSKFSSREHLHLRIRRVFYSMRQILKDYGSCHEKTVKTKSYHQTCLTESQ